jgi:hypothetical protein
VNEYRVAVVADRMKWLAERVKGGDTTACVDVPWLAAELSAALAAPEDPRLTTIGGGRVVEKVGDEFHLRAPDGTLVDSWHVASALGRELIAATETRADRVEGVLRSWGVR